MLLAVDVGNTSMMFAVFEGDTVRGTWQFSTDTKRTADEYAVSLQSMMALSDIAFSEIDDVIISCVVPKHMYALTSLARQYFDCNPLIVGSADVDLDIKICLERPSEVGADRLVNAVAVREIYAEDSIIIDFGTATTFDIVTAKGDYLGGAIAPGIHLSVDALHKAAAKLPEVAVTRPKNVIGTNTVSAIQSGIYYGYKGVIEGIVSQMRSEYKHPLKVIATGGLASLFSKGDSIIEEVRRDLTIQGLRLIYQKNK